ncbi:glycosyltransferase 87 family protein [Frankia sp. Cpl3]|nr:glycosyltransferase 87 family protein [Frankia sp. Cpl3]
MAGTFRGMRRARDGYGDRPLLAGWILSRVLLLLLAVHGQVFGAQQSVRGDLDLYRAWGRILVHDGAVPGDEKWQYPPGAAVLLALPGAPREWLGVPYEVSFLLLILAVDAAVTWALARRSHRAARYWLLTTLALGPVTVARFDLVPAAAALAALLALDARPGRFGGWVALGAAVKVWPGLLLVSLGRGGLAGRRGDVLARGGRIAAGAAAVVAGLAVALALAGWWRGALGFLDAQSARGLQIEAVSATPFVVARMFGAGEAPAYSHGSLQFDGTAARGVATACSVVEMILILVAVLFWWARRPGPDAGQPTAADIAGRGLALVMIISVTSRVLSPQYLIWMLVLVAARIALTPDGSAEPVRPVPPVRPDGRGLSMDPAVLLAVAAVLTQVVYPWRYNDVVQGRVVGSLLLLARNVLLVIVAWYALRTSVASPPLPAPSRPAEPRARRPAAARLARAAARCRRAGTAWRHTATPT